MRINRSNYKHTNLFLLRVWCDDPVERENGETDEGDRDGSGLKWHGRLQGTVSGESHSFDGKDALIEVLERMLYKERPGHAVAPASVGSRDNISSRGNKPNEANR